MRSKSIVVLSPRRPREPVAGNGGSNTRLRAGLDDVVTAMVGDIYMLEPRVLPCQLWPKKYKSVLDVFNAQDEGEWVWGVSGRLNR